MGIWHATLIVMQICKAQEMVSYFVFDKDNQEN